MESIGMTAPPASPEIILDDIALSINGNKEIPTRDEFYTNYPFFKYWKSDNNDRLQNGEGVNIYIHIPFCIQICDYCFYMKELIKSKSQVDEYIDTLCAEMELVSDKYNLRRRKVNSIYIGGGTPSVLTEPQFKKLIDQLHACHLIEQPEFTFEAEPGTFSKNKLQWYKDNGINRISMGVQSFDDEVIKMSSRKHTTQQAINSIRMVQDTGGFSLNIDLLSGLAGEKMDTWEKSVNTAIENHVDMLTIYKMKTYANTVFFKKGVHTQEIALPTKEQEINFMERALEMMSSTEYKRWSTFAFTRNGYKHSYAENTWRGQDLVAYGASSFGKIGNINYQNINNIDQYTKRVRENKMSVYRTYSLSSKDMIVKELLLCAARLATYRKEEFVSKFGFDYFDMIPGVIKELVDKGYITDNKEELTLTNQGILFGDFVGQVLASSVKNAIGNDTIGFVY